MPNRAHLTRIGGSLWGEKTVNSRETQRRKDHHFASDSFPMCATCVVVSTAEKWRIRSPHFLALLTDERVRQIERRVLELWSLVWRDKMLRCGNPPPDVSQWAAGDKSVFISITSAFWILGSFISGVFVFLSYAYDFINFRIKSLPFRWSSCNAQNVQNTVFCELCVDNSAPFFVHLSHLCVNLLNIGQWNQWVIIDNWSFQW